MKFITAVFISILTFLGASSQTLFTYGPYKVSNDEFIRAFRKNNEAVKVTEADVKRYLDLYTRFRLKVQDAYDMKLDTIISKQEDVANFRKQIEDQFMIDADLLQHLIKEAKQRGTREIRVSHIFIPFKEEFIANGFVELEITAADSQHAFSKINEAYKKLMSGEAFDKVALEFSSDQEVKNNKGDLGYITVFSLPYVIETAAYNLPLNGVSKPFASDKGYHIVKKTEERDARGRIQVQQILLANDPDGGPSAKQAALKLADSLYKVITKGASFDDLARTYSMDLASAPSGGFLPPIQVGLYDPAFENKVFGLTKDGDVSAPFETPLGIHIVKRLQQYKIDTISMAGTPWNVAMDQDRRGQLPKLSFEKKTVGLTGMKTRILDLNELFRYCDSIYAGKKPYSPIINDNTVLLEFPDSKVVVNDWLAFTGVRAYQKSRSEYYKLWNEFKQVNSVAYYRKNLDKYNPEFRQQLKEFMEGNMLFEVMERKVWSKAAGDSAGLVKTYNANKTKYTWGKSAAAVVITATDVAVANEARTALIEKPTEWRNIMESSGGRIMADSGRMEWQQIAPAKTELKNKMMTPVQVNPQDQSASFSYIVKTYPGPDQKSFPDAKVQVINDYQTILEEDWITTLKKKYPVTLDPKQLSVVVGILTR